MGPAAAANDQTFQDPVGDNEGAGTQYYAADIVSVQIVSEDDGGITVTITLETLPGDQGTLFTNDYVEIDFDADSDETTGDSQGFELALVAFGHGSSPPTGLICRLQPDTNQLACEPIEVVSVVNSPRHALTFRFEQANWFNIRFSAFTQFPSPSGANFDNAPGSGYFEFDVRADPDGDGVSGFADLCPNKKGGRFDRDNDGCPGPYETLPPIRISYEGFFRTSSSVIYRGFSVTNVPRNALVKVKVGKRTYTRRGSGVVRALNGRPLPAGLKIVFTTSAPGACSWQRIIRIRPSSSTGFVTLRDAVVRPRGIDCV